MTTYFSEQSAAGVAAGLCVVSMLIVVLFVPPSTKDPARASYSRDSYSESSISANFEVNWLYQ